MDLALAKKIPSKAIPGRSEPPIQRRLERAGRFFRNSLVLGAVFFRFLREIVISTCRTTLDLHSRAARAEACQVPRSGRLIASRERERALLEGALFLVATRNAFERDYASPYYDTDLFPLFLFLFFPSLLVSLCLFSFFAFLVLLPFFLILSPLSWRTNVPSDR